MTLKEYKEIKRLRKQIDDLKKERSELMDFRTELFYCKRDVDCSFPLSAIDQSELKVILIDEYEKRIEILNREFEGL